MRRLVPGTNPVLRAIANDYQYNLSSFDPFNPSLISYAKLRREVYEANNLPYYSHGDSNGFCDYDKNPYNKFVIGTHKETRKVVGGIRINISSSKYRLRVEDNTNKSLPEMLPHLDLAGLSYAEFGALAVSPTHQKKGVAKAIYSIAYDYIKTNGFAVVLADLVPSNVYSYAKAAEENGATQIVYRPDLVGLEDGSKDEIMMVSFMSREKLPLLSEEMIKSGINGKLPTPDRIEERKKTQTAARLVPITTREGR